MTITYLPGRRESLVNQTDLTLNGTINATTNSITLNDASSLPSDATIRFRIENELLLCNAISGNTCTVTRGIEGTTGATHNDGTSVDVVLTPGGLENFLLQNSYHGCFTQEATPIAVPDNRLLNASGNVLTVSDFTWLNQGTATASDSGKGGFYIQTQNEAQWQWRGLLLAVPSTPYSVFAHMRFGPGYSAGSGGSTMLAGWYQSGTGEIEGAGIRAQDAAAFWQFNSVTSFNATVDSTAAGYMMGRDMWVRITDDATSHKVQFSYNQTNWSRDASTFMQNGSTAFLTASHICFLVSSNGGRNDQVFHFEAVVVEEQ